jgi:hypothetical protein
VDEKTPPSLDHAPVVRPIQSEPMRAVIRGLLHTAAVIVPITAIVALIELLTYTLSGIDWFVLGVAVSIPLIGGPTIAGPAILHTWYDEPLIGSDHVFGRAPGRRPPPIGATTLAVIFGLLLSMTLIIMIRWGFGPGRYPLPL